MRVEFGIFSLLHGALGIVKSRIVPNISCAYFIRFTRVRTGTRKLDK